MAIIYGSIFVLAGFIAAVFSALQLARANPSVPLPLFAAAPNRPRISIFLNVGSTALVIWGANIMTSGLGPWVFLLLFVALLAPFLVIRTWHNRRVAAAR